jgi:hypothetical protein
LTTGSVTADSGFSNYGTIKSKPGPTNLEDFEAGRYAQQWFLGERFTPSMQPPMSFPDVEKSDLEDNELPFVAELFRD